MLVTPLILHVQERQMLELSSLLQNMQGLRRFALTVDVEDIVSTNRHADHTAFRQHNWPQPLCRRLCRELQHLQHFFMLRPQRYPPLYDA